MSEKITLTRQVDQPPVSLAQMLKHQYVSREFSSIFASTEIREIEIVGTAGVFSTRFVTMILMTKKWQLEALEGEQKKNIEERLYIKRLIEEDSCAMSFVLQDSYLFAFGLLRQSLKRQSRKEAVAIATSPREMRSAEGMSMKDKMFTKMGISSKYKNVAVEK